MRGRGLTILLGMALLAAPGAALDPAMLGLVMPDATLVAGADADRVRNSPLGMYLLGQASQSRFDRLIEATGFDPRRDAREVLVASSGEANSIAVVRGSFDLAKLTQAALAHGGSVAAYKSATMLRGKRPDRSVALLNGVLLIAGPSAAVEAAVDRSLAGASPGADLAARIQSLSTSYDAWMLATSPPAAFLRPEAQNQPFGQLAKAVESAVGGVRLGANVEMMCELTAANEQDAAGLGGIAMLVAAMAARQPGGTLLGSLQSSIEGRVVKLSLTMPEANVERMLQQNRRRNQIALQ